MALRTVDDVFADYLGRRRGIIKALTVEVRPAAWQRAHSIQHPLMHGLLRAGRRSTCAPPQAGRARRLQGLQGVSKILSQTSERGGPPDARSPPHRGVAALPAPAPANTLHFVLRRCWPCRRWTSSGSSATPPRRTCASMATRTAPGR